MFRFKNKAKNLFNCVSVSLLSLLIMNCGGGGGGDSSPEQSQANTVTPIAPDTNNIAMDYSPDVMKLENTASTSTDLYVDQTFTFNNFKNVVFDIDVTDMQSNPLQNVKLSISKIDNEVTNFDDPRLAEKSLLISGNSNANGQIYFTLELPVSVENVLLELNALGIENDVIIPIDDSGVVLHHFKQN